MNQHIVLRRVKYPGIGFPREPRPEVPPRIFADRLSRLRRRMNERQLDALVVYGDREHFANLAWLTHFDPRFEEALLVILPAGNPVLLVGNEGMIYSRIARLNVRRQLYQTFSLLGQPRERVQPLAGLLREAGIQRGARVGAVGWKYFEPSEVEDPESALDLPEFIAQAVRNVAGSVTNQTAIFMDPETGLRNELEAEQIADFEWAATWNSQSVLQAIASLRAGITEMQAFEQMRCAGLAWSCHAVLTSGPRLRGWFMGSPTSCPIKRGEPMLIGQAYRGANNCRFGWMARTARDLPVAARDYLDRVASPYFSAVAAWYEALRVGTTGDSLHRAVWDHLTPLGFRLGLNIGHQTAADEWTHSLASAGSARRVGSGQYWQADFFASLPGAHVGGYIEDGVVVADAGLRRRLARRWPAMWKRFEARRRFMTDQLGIGIGPEVLPMSNFPAAVIPWLLASDHCMVSPKQKPKEPGVR